jgi:hypothetical protein
MKQAVGTSLFIIFINSLIGFGGDLIGGVELNYILSFRQWLFWDAYRNSNIQKKLMGKIKTCFWMVCINNGNLHYRHRISHKVLCNTTTEYID